MNARNATARRLLAGALAISEDRIGTDASIETLEAWDSLAHMRLVLAIEQELGRELTPDRIAGIGSLADIAAALGDS